jgi:hypothetical protein
MGRRSAFASMLAFPSLVSTIGLWVSCRMAVVVVSFPLCLPFSVPT